MDDAVDCAIVDLVQVRRAEFHRVFALVAVELRSRRNRWDEEDASERHDDEKLEKQEQKLLAMPAITDGSEYWLGNHADNRQHEVNQPHDRGRIAELLGERRHKGNDWCSA